MHPDNLVPLKLAILKHLPVLGGQSTFIPHANYLRECLYLVFNADKEFEPKDAGKLIFRSCSIRDYFYSV